MISFDDNSGSSNVNLNPIYMSLNILSDQQQTFESDLNNMMIDIQLISNSLSTLTGGGGNEYYITDSATNTDKLSFCYNLKDNITGFNFTDQFNNINMNGGSFNSNTISGSSKMFNLNGADLVSSNLFSSFSGNVNLTCSRFCNNTFTKMTEFNINAIYASKNRVEGYQEFGHIISVESDTHYGSTVDLTGLALKKVYVYRNNLVNFNYNYINSLTCTEVKSLNISGYSLYGNYISKITTVNFIGLWQGDNIFSSIKSNNVKALSIWDNEFSMNTNLNLSAEGIRNNIFSIVNTLNFNCNDFEGNIFLSTMNMMFGTVDSMFANNISDVSKISLNGNMISDNTFNNCTICDVNALTFKYNTFSGNNTIKLLNMTCDLIDSNSFGFPKIANIMVSSFNNNTIDVAYYLDLKADTIISNAIFGGKLNGMFDGQGNTILANYATLCGTLISNDLKLINGRIHGGLAANTIHGSSYSYNDISSTIGRLTINNYTSFGLNTNVISCFDVVHVDGERGPMLYKDIRKLYLDSLNSDDSFSNVKSIYYSDSFALGSNHYTNIGTLYYWQNKTQPSWSP